ncbi:hypothetical protein BDY21DRAFT_285308 [Lineolata rhizophorae]|uniref:Uncharacterized protein n=1 Tax=Lineolata rhizophorae TaxID=578093 RepID=A0A6A6P2A9_9PEZI|nr:hypothetical protein BDY21DRAFT_285308 [Lineolata rhizophorae]
MVGKKSGKALQREEGLERTDNNMDLTTWPQVNMINQKNYYTEYLKRDDQFLAFRTQNEEATNRMVREARDRDRALAQSSRGVTMAGDGTAGAGGDAMDVDEDLVAEDNTAAVATQEARGSKIIVMHPGSQNLRVGLASDALPKTVPMVIARRDKENESEAGDGEPSPKRVKIDDELPEEPEKWFGEEFSKKFASMATELKQRMRNNKRRLLPNSKELVINYNRRGAVETISEHNDPLRIDWTELPPNPAKAPDYFTGQAALRIPEQSKPRYKLFWPIRNGWFNEHDYTNKNLLFEDFSTIVEEALKSELGLSRRKDWSQYSCVFVIPDLYEKNYVISILDIMLRNFGFGKVCFMQESLAATFGAGYSISCIVDIGAQKTSICCVEEGLCSENSRINLKYGGWDVTETFIKMMLHDWFPYEDINLKRRYDYLLAEELKQKYVTMNESDINVQTYDFHLRAAGQDTRKFVFKTYDETMLAPMGFFRPDIFDNSWKLERRRNLIDRSYDLYDGSPNDPTSIAQNFALEFYGGIPTATNGSADGPSSSTPAPSSLAPPSRQQPASFLSRFNDLESTPRTSVANSPAPDGGPGTSTPQPGRASPAVGGAGGLGDGSGGPAAGPTAAMPVYDPTAEKIGAAEARDRVLPSMPLDRAILASVAQGARGDERKMRDFYGGIMVVGGGSKIPGLNNFLEQRLRELQPGLAKEILVGVPPRDLDPQVLVWKGASVFGKMSSSGNDSWIGQKEYDVLGSRLLMHKCMFNW